MYAHMPFFESFFLRLFHEAEPRATAAGFFIAASISCERSNRLVGGD